MKKELFLLLTFMLNVSVPGWGAKTVKQAQKYEYRGQISSVAHTKNFLRNLKAEELRQYSFTDYIYLPHTARIAHEYYRIRQHDGATWPQKNVNLVHKKAIPRTKKMRTAQFKEFSNLKMAQHSLPADVDFLFSYKRKGAEYQHHGFKIYVEEIENLPPTVKIVSEKLEEETREFMHSLGVIFFYTKSVPNLILSTYQ